jgi:hypothetical protein
MPPLTHVLAGWCAGNVLRLTAKERTLCIVASVLPDIDGLSLFGGVVSYQTYRHVLCHNLTVGLAATLAVVCLCRCSLKASVAFLLLFHLHLFMDIFGSGPGWGIAYFWPWTSRVFYSSHAWSFTGWQNQVAFLVFAGWTAYIAVRCRRTPLEFVTPRLDGLVLRILRRTAAVTPVTSPTRPVNPVSTES